MNSLHRSSSMHIIAHLFMQDPKNNSSTSRKPWYQRAMEIKTPRNITSPKSPEIPLPYPILNKNLSTSTKYATTPERQKLRKSTSFKVAISFTRVCLCAPISSYTDVVFHAGMPSRRSNTYPRSKPFPNCIQECATARTSTEGRRIFRGKSLTDDVLMRRFLVEEDAMMKERRRNEMEVMRKRNAKRRRKLGPSPLSRMVLAEEDALQNKKKDAIQNREVSRMAQYVENPSLKVVTYGSSSVNGF